MWYSINIRGVFKVEFRVGVFILRFMVLLFLGIFEDFEIEDKILFICYLFWGAKRFISMLKGLVRIKG